MNTSPLEVNKPMSIGVTGTRSYPSSGQIKMMSNLIKQLGPGGVEVHHGDCIGVDNMFHHYAKAMEGWTIVVHPPTIERYRANVATRHAGVVADVIELDPLPYLERNHMIVDNSEVLFAYPKEQSTDPKEHMRSGTWATIRYALADGLCVVLGLPDGAIYDLRPNAQGSAVQTFIGYVQ